MTEKEISHCRRDRRYSERALRRRRGRPARFLLRTWANVPDKTALATCVAVIFPFCLASLLVYALCGALPLREALPYLFGGLVGGWIGGKLFKNVPNTWLKRIFALFLLYGAARYLL